MYSQFLDPTNDFAPKRVFGTEEELGILLVPSYAYFKDHICYVGMNYLKCSHIRLELAQRKLTKISSFVQPIEVFYPPNKILANEKKLTGFSWYVAERPTPSNTSTWP